MKDEPTNATMVVLYITPDVRRFYRQARVAGLSRRDSNFLTAGLVMAHAGGVGLILFEQTWKGWSKDEAL